MGAGGNSLHYSPNSSYTARNKYFATFPQTERVYSPLLASRPAEGDPLPQEARDVFSRRRPDEWRMDVQIPLTSPALSGTRSVNDESVLKANEAEKFEFDEPWPHASIFSIRGKSLLAAK